MDISDFLRFERASQSGSEGALFWLSSRSRRKRIFILPTKFAPARGWFAFKASVEIGDAPGKIHPLFCAAILSSISAPPNLGMEYLRSLEIPRIAFSTPDDIRRSMTLNAMRMTTEYRQSGSSRVLQLVENRLELGQRDIVHDLLVYVMRQIFDVRAAQREERDNRADSVAAYLGLNATQVRTLFQRERLSPTNIAAHLQNGKAGTIKRALDVPALLASQIALLEPELRHVRALENHYLTLLDEIVARLQIGKSTPE